MAMGGDTAAADVDLQAPARDSNKNGVPEPPPPPPKTRLALHERRAFPYIVCGASLLALIAGYVNTCAFLVYQRLVSHVTGSTSKMSIAAASGDREEVWTLALLLVAFCTGSAGAGLALKLRSTNEFVLGSRYGTLLFAIAASLVAGVFAAEAWSPIAGVSMWAWGMGLQNAMCTSFSGAVVRTTHMTGLLTDVGLICGQYLRHRLGHSGRPAVWKLALLLPILFGFWLGGLLAYLLDGSFHAAYGMLVPAALLGAMGAAYMVAQQQGVFVSFQKERAIEEKIEGAEAEARSAALAALAAGDGAAASELHACSSSTQLRPRPAPQHGTDRDKKSPVPPGSAGAEACAGHVRPIASENQTKSALVSGLPLVAAIPQV